LELTDTHHISLNENVCEQNKASTPTQEVHAMLLRSNSRNFLSKANVIPSCCYSNTQLYFGIKENTYTWKRLVTKSFIHSIQKAKLVIVFFHMHANFRSIKTKNISNILLLS
jgi:hypothetical protein